MKKYIIFLAAGAIALSACTSEEVVDVSPTQSNAIGFENVVNKSSRAEDLTFESFKNFQVYGYYVKAGMTTPVQIFANVPVHKTTVDGETTWIYDGKRYWVPGCSYYFYAYSCDNVALAEGNGSTGMTVFNNQVTSVEGRALSITQYRCDSQHQHDLVTAKNENIKSQDKGNKDVSLAFTHALCKVKAEFTTDFPSNYQIKISNVYLSSFFNKADFNVSTGEWSSWISETSPTPTVSLSVPEDNNTVENKAGSKVPTGEAFLIPKEYDNTKNEFARIHFTIAVYNKQSGELILERNIHGTWAPQWSKGNIYQYSILISGSTAGIEPIVFAASQSMADSSWGSTTSVSMSFGVDAAEQPASEGE